MTAAPVLPVGARADRGRSRGRHVPTADADGEVALVTTSTAYLSLRVSAAVRPVVAVHDGRGALPCGPATLVVDALPQLRPGDRVRVRDGLLVATAPGVGPVATVDVGGTPLWAPPPRPPIEPARASALATALLGGGSAALAGAHQRLAARLGAVLGALRSRDGAALDEAVARTVGFGPGLTPSGDDALAGLLLTAANLAGAEALAAHLAAAVWSRLDATTALAAQLLALACEGEADEAVDDVLRSCAAGSVADVARAAAGLLALGATSGADTLYGIVSGLLLADAPARAVA